MWDRGALRLQQPAHGADPAPAPEFGQPELGPVHGVFPRVPPLPLGGRGEAPRHDAAQCGQDHGPLTRQGRGRW